MVRAFAGDSTITRRVPRPLVAALSLPLARFAAGGVLAATHSPSSPAPTPGPVLSVDPASSSSQPAIRPASLQLPGLARVFPTSHPAPPDSRVANFSSQPIEPPRTPSTI